MKKNDLLRNVFTYLFAAVTVLIGLCACTAASTGIITSTVTSISTKTVTSSASVTTTATSSPTTSPASTGTITGSQSNGQMIYFSGIDIKGQSINYSQGPFVMMRLACVTCHGPEGEGGQVCMMMTGCFNAADIKWPTLTGHYTDHAPYTIDTLKQAITRGVDPAGNSLDPNMPRWSMSDTDLNDLISFLQTLS
jgi:cytochrome c oxidase subunit II